MQKNQALPTTRAGLRAQPRVVGFEGIGQMLNEASATGPRAPADEARDQAWRDRSAGLGRDQDSRALWDRVIDL